MKKPNDYYQEPQAEKDKGKKCPICKGVLQNRASGKVCKNWKCPLYWKFGGWTYIKKVEKF